jgi:nucleotide-binding universal stress UspA family protein
MVADVPTATREHPEQERLTVGVPAPGGVVRLKPAATVETRDQAMARIADELRDYLSAEATPLEKAGIPVHAAVRFGQPADEIVRYANEQKMDLIVMATHGHTGLARLVFGGVASQVVANGGYPVLLVRPQSLNDG